MLFSDHFGRNALFGSRAPGRVNLIGEHTDYNHGFVLPMAIERDTVVLGAPRNDSILKVYASNLGKSAEVSLQALSRSTEHPWIDYISGVAFMLLKNSHNVTGADILVQGDVPIGCGLSSSASLEMAVLGLFEIMNGFHLEDPLAATLCQRIENEYLGVSSGIMDPFIARLGQKKHALFVDCRSLEYNSIPADLSEAQFVIADTGVPRALTDSKYNERVEECQRAVDILQTKTGKKGTHLRDFELEEIEAQKESLPEREYRRARHVITENQRTLDACEVLRNGNVITLGALMNASDQSLDKDYAVVSDELRCMTEIARGLEGCYGSRMTGAGFGGCTISLVDRKRVDEFCAQLRTQYEAACPYTCTTIVSSPAAGSHSFAFKHDQ